MQYLLRIDWPNSPLRVCRICSFRLSAICPHPHPIWVASFFIVARVVRRPTSSMINSAHRSVWPSASAAPSYIWRWAFRDIYCLPANAEIATRWKRGCDPGVPREGASRLLTSIWDNRPASNCVLELTLPRVAFALIGALIRAAICSSFVFGSMLPVTQPPACSLAVSPRPVSDTRMPHRYRPGERFQRAVYLDLPA